MLFVKRILIILLFLSFALSSIKSPALAEQLNNSVKECIDQPEKCKEAQPPKIEEGSQAENRTGKVGLNAWDFIKMVLATLFVIALLYTILKFVNKKSKQYKNFQLIENLGGTALGANKSVQLIKIGNRILVVGVGENIQLLKEIEDPEEYQQIILTYGEKTEQYVQPSDLASRIFQRIRRKSTRSPIIKDTASEFQTLIKQQLEDMTRGRKNLYKEIEKKGQTNDE